MTKRRQIFAKLTEADVAEIERSRLPRKRQMGCVDCRIAHATWMVHDHLWAQVFPTSDGKICVACFARRLGRDLRAEDFTDAPCNAAILYAYSAASRAHLTSRGER